MLKDVIRHLSTEDDTAISPTEDGKSSRASSILSMAPSTAAADRFWTLQATQKLAIISALSDDALTCKSISDFMQECESNLTELRKEKIDLSRDRKRMFVSLQQHI